MESPRLFDASTAAVVLIDPRQGIVPHLSVERPLGTPLPPPAGASQWVADGGYRPGVDLLFTERQWGACRETDLNERLRRRGVRTVVVGGIAINFGVESAARVLDEVSR